MISSRVLTSVIGAYALTVALIAPQVSRAATAADVPTATVRYGDLNLDTRSGAETVYRRIDSAATVVCSRYQTSGSLFLSPAFRRCKQTALANAVRRVDAPLLSASYAQHEHSHGLDTASR